MPTNRLDEVGLTALDTALANPGVLARYGVKVTTVPGSECLWWTGAVAGRSDRERTDGGGHGRFWFATDRVIIAHRFAFAVVHGASLALTEVLDTTLTEYLPFIILLFALFVISGGIRIRSNLVGTPGINTGLLAIGRRREDADRAGQHLEHRRGLGDQLTVGIGGPADLAGRCAGY